MDQSGSTTPLPPSKSVRVLVVFYYDTLKAAYPSKEVFLIFLISKKTEDKPSVC
jgi:hypothetical protein